MLKFFKNLFGSGQSAAAEDQAVGNGYEAAPAPVATAHQHPYAANDPRLARTTSPAAHAMNPAPGGSIQVPLHAIIAVLPLELKTRIRQTMVAGIAISMPVSKVLAQLVGGTVKMSFGELRAAVPDIFTPQPDRDAVQITLPLNSILPQINPALLPRRRAQRQVDVPEDVRGPFGGDGFGVAISETKTITGTPITTSTETAAPLAPTAAPEPDSEPDINQIFVPKSGGQPTPPVRPPTPQVRPPTPPVRPPTPPVRPPAPVVPNNLRPPVSRGGSFASSPTPPPPTATPSGFPPVRPAFPTARDVGATPLPTPIPRMAAVPSNGNGHGHAPAPQAPQALSAGPDAVLTVPLAAISDSWPEAVRGEIAQLNLSGVHLALPIRVIDPALRQGKIAFTWKVLRSWIRPATLPTVSAHDAMILELPLHVIAPLFIGQQKNKGSSRQKAGVDENIPNLFFGFPQGDSVPIEEPPAAAPPPPPPPRPLPLPKPAAPATGASPNFAPAPKPAGLPDTNFYVWGDSADTPRVDETEFKRKSPTGTDFLTRYATPNEVVSRAAALEGVAGALVALPDGLMVASKLSPDLNGDTLAAFLPHIFGKISQCTKELRMGELNNLHFTVGNVPWKIFRVNAIYFAAFGRAGQPLPTSQLAGLAAELDRKKPQ